MPENALNNTQISTIQSTTTGRMGKYWKLLEYGMLPRRKYHRCYSTPSTWNGYRPYDMVYAISTHFMAIRRANNHIATHAHIPRFLMLHYMHCMSIKYKTITIIIIIERNYFMSVVITERSSLPLPSVKLTAYLVHPMPTKHMSTKRRSPHSICSVKLRLSSDGCGPRWLNNSMANAENVSKAKCVEMPSRLHACRHHRLAAQQNTQWTLLALLLNYTYDTFIWFIWG